MQLKIKAKTTKKRADHKMINPRDKFSDMFNQEKRERERKH